MLVRDGCLSVYGILTCFKRKQGRKKRALDEKKKLVFGVFYILEREILQHIWEG